jgi:hypothetical protein
MRVIECRDKRDDCSYLRLAVDHTSTNFENDDVGDIVQDVYEKARIAIGDVAQPV